MTKQVIVIIERGNEWVEKSTILRYTFMVIEVGKMLLEVFAGSFGCDFLKNHPSLVASELLVSHTAVGVLKRFS
jgi:hypothetical protein